MQWSDQVWDRVDEVVHDYLKECNQGNPVCFGEMVPHPSDPARTLVLLTLIKIDQEQRWPSDQRLLVEEYLERWPELRDAPEAVVELVAAECRTRIAAGERLTRRELEQRFPSIAARVWRACMAEAELETGQEELTSAITDSRSANAQVSRPTASPQPAALSVGTRLVGFRIVGHLGSGGMGSVYLAEDEQLRREVAVKVLHPWIFPANERGDLLLDEARKVSRLNHPSIVPVFQMGRGEDGKSFVVMEYVPGESLAACLSRGPVSAIQATVWAGQLAAALQCAHQQGWVHRDVKPANVLVDQQGRARLTDFGLAIHERELGLHAGEDSGTLPYMAPEQIRGETHVLDGRADVWSLGVVLYEMLTGQRPFQADSREGLREAILTRQPRPLRQVHTAVPLALEKICLRCLAKSPAERYASAADLCGELQTWRGTPQRRRWIGTALGLTVAAVMGVIFLNRGLLNEPSPGPVLPAAAPVPAVPPPSLERLDGSVDVWIYNQDDPSRRNLRIHERHARPLRWGDVIRVRATLDTPAYLYLLWIDATGRVDPVYPWQPGRWHEKLPAGRLAEIDLPENIDEGWPISGQDGMETVLLLARREPLPEDVDLPSLLADLPPQPMQDRRALVWFKNGQLVSGSQPRDRTRGPQWFDPQKIEDPIFQTQREIYGRLREHFDLIVANSFAFEG